jgi:hypothetical protein
MPGEFFSSGILLFTEFANETQGFRRRNLIDFLQFSANAQFVWLQSFISSPSCKLAICDAPNEKFVEDERENYRRETLHLLNRPNNVDSVEQASAI